MLQAFATQFLSSAKVVGLLLSIVKATRVRRRARLLRRDRAARRIVWLMRHVSAQRRVERLTRRHAWWSLLSETFPMGAARAARAPHASDGAPAADLPSLRLPLTPSSDADVASMAFASPSVASPTANAELVLDRSLLRGGAVLPLAKQHSTPEGLCQMGHARTTPTSGTPSGTP